MKRIFALIALLIVMACLFVGCKYTECELCGDKGFCSKVTVLGEDGYVCSDCKADLKEWGLLD